MKGAGHSALRHPLQLRFSFSNKVLQWRSDMASKSSFLAALVDKVHASEGPAAELDEEERVLVDDSNFEAEVSDVLIAILEGAGLPGHLSAEKLVQCLRCADYFGLQDDEIWNLEQAFWANWKSPPPQPWSWRCFDRQDPWEESDPWTGGGRPVVLDFQGLCLRGPIAHRSMTIHDITLCNLESSNLVVRDELTIVGCKLLKSSFDAVVTKLSTLRSSFINSKMPAAGVYYLRTAVVTDCEWFQAPVEHFTARDSSLTNTTLPQLGDFILSKSTVSRLNVPHAGRLYLHEENSLKDCRLRQCRSPRHSQDASCDSVAGALSAMGCIFSGAIFVLKREPLSFTKCTFYRCTFKLNSVWYCVAFESCSFVDCAIRLEAVVDDFGDWGSSHWGPEVTDPESLRCQLGSHFRDGCEILLGDAGLRALPEEQRIWLQ